MDQVYINCRLYNGTDSFVGKIGVDVNREYDNLLQAYGLKERFENKIDTNALISEILGAQIFGEEPREVQQPQSGYEHRDQQQVNREPVRYGESNPSPALQRAAETQSTPNTQPSHTEPPRQSFDQAPLHYQPQTTIQTQVEPETPQDSTQPQMSQTQTISQPVAQYSTQEEHHQMPEEPNQTHAVEEVQSQNIQKEE